MTRVGLVALSIGNAMGPYVQMLSNALARHVDLHIFVPDHFHQAVDDTVQVHRFPTGATRPRALVRFLNPLGALSLWRQFRESQCEVFHLFNGDGYPWGPLLAAFAAHDDVPLVTTVHDPDAHPDLVDQINAVARSFTIRRSRYVHIQAERFVDVIAERGVSRDHISVIPLASFAPQFLAHRSGSRSREKLALNFGRMAKYKGLGVLARAAQFLPEGWKVVMAGPGTIPADARRIVDGQPHRFEIYERFVDDREVAELLERAAVFVLPYTQASNATGTLISAAFGVPVVGSALGGLLDDIPAVNGLLVPPNDPAALASAIVEASKLRPVYPEGYEFSDVARAFAALYTKALSQS